MQEKRMQGESAKQVTIDVLRAAGEPLHAKEVAKRVIDSGRGSRLKGKTPEATIAAILAVGSKPGGPFKRVDKGTYTIAEAAASETEKAQPRKRATARRATKKPRPANASA
jgi:HB1, ASXL, restriction endonuclease HTH domain